MTDTERLDFVLTHNCEWQGFCNHPTNDDYEELQVWNRGNCETYEAKTRRDCIDKAIINRRYSSCTEDII